MAKRRKLGDSFCYSKTLRSVKSAEVIEPAPAERAGIELARNPFTMAQILIVEDESGLRESLLEGLSVAFPDSSFGAHGTVEEALEAIEGQQPELIISDIRLPGKSGIDFLFIAKNLWPGIRFILITAYANVATYAQASEYEATRLLKKPFALHDLVKAVREALRNGSSSQGEDTSILELVQLANLGKKSLEIHLRRGATRGEICLVNGDLIHARAGGQEGIAAFMEMVRWQRRDAEIRTLRKAPRTTVEEPIQFLVHEALRILDEKDGDTEKPTRSVPSESSLLSAKEPLQVSSAPKLPLAAQSEETLAQAGLDALVGIDGYLGACLMNSESGRVLSARSAASLDVEVAAACNTEVIRAERATLVSLGLQDRIEDILISLGRQYHLLCLIDSNPDLVLYLILDRAQANLAVARYELSTLASALDLGRNP